MNILITGSTGLIGSRIIELLGAKYTFIPLLQSEIDITDKSSVEHRLSGIDFDLLLHLAAYTNVDGAERERELCHKINVDGTRYLFEMCETKKAKMIHISTDFVFDGKLVYPSPGKVAESQQFHPSPREGVPPTAGRKGYVIHDYNPSLIILAKQKRNAMTASEVKLWTLLKSDLIGYDFHRQKVIGDYIVDFYCPGLELVIEVDGKVHEYTERTDEERQDFLESRGIKVLRIPNEHIKDGIEVWIKKRCDERNESMKTPSVSRLRRGSTFPREGLSSQSTDDTITQHYHPSTEQIHTQGFHPSLGKVPAPHDYPSLGKVPEGRKGFIPTFTEDSQPNPISYYGQTKYEAEQIVKNRAMIVRLSYPYRKEFEGKRDFVRTVKYLLEQGKPLSMVTDSLITPTFIDDMVHGLDYLFTHYSPEVFHLVGADSMSPYDAGKMIAKAFGLDEELIRPTTYEEYFKGKALRPQWARIENTKITALNISQLGEGLLKTLP